MSSKRPNDAYREGQPSHTNYKIIDPGADEISVVCITDGKFRGVKFRFGAVSFNDGLLSFRTEIIRKPLRLLFTNLKENDLFTEVTGNILVDLIQANANECHKFLVG